MLKKALGLVIAVVMLLGVFGLTACTESLTDYKAKGKTSQRHIMYSGSDTTYVELQQLL